MTSTVPLSLRTYEILTVAWRTTSAAKALYRQGLAQVTLKEYDEAEKVFLEAHSLAKDDKSIISELERLRQRKKAQRDKEKAAYKKIFA